MGFGRGLQPPTSYRFAACLRSATEASLRFIVDLDDQVHALKTQLAERVAGRIAGRIPVVVVSCIMYPMIPISSAKIPVSLLSPKAQIPAMCQRLTLTTDEVQIRHLAGVGHPKKALGNPKKA